jgi:hypothetical protein
VRIINKRHETREFALTISGMPGSLLEVVGGAPRADRRTVIEIGPDQTREVRALVTSYNDTQPASVPIGFHLLDVATGERANTADHFRGP